MLFTFSFQKMYYMSKIIMRYQRDVLFIAFLQVTHPYRGLLDVANAVYELEIRTKLDKIYFSQ